MQGSEPVKPGIKRLAWIDDPKQLQSNPDNWRKHPDRQLKALVTSIKENGWAGALLYNEITGRLIDGHARKEISVSELQSICPVPVLIGTWTVEQERRLLATLDPISAMAEMDTERLRSLNRKINEDIAGEVDAISSESQVVLEGLVADLNSYADNIDSDAFTPMLFPSREGDVQAKTGGKDFNTEFSTGEKIAYEFKASDEYNGVYAVRENIVFPCNNELGIPELRPDMLSDQIPTETWAPGKPITDASKLFFLYGSNRIGGDNSPTEAQGGVLGFFIDDERFEALWVAGVEMIDRMKKNNWGGVLTPDFSLWWGWPMALKIYNLYRSRWLGRIWQEAGIKVIPGLVVGGNPERAEMECIGIPKGAPVVAFECRAGYAKEEEKKAHERRILIECINRQTEIIQPGTVLIYGGVEHEKWVMKGMREGPNYVLLEQWATVRAKCGGWRQPKPAARNYDAQTGT